MNPCCHTRRPATYIENFLFLWRDPWFLYLLCQCFWCVTADRLVLTVSHVVFERQKPLVSLLRRWISFERLCFCLVFNLPPDQMAAAPACLLSCDRAPVSLKSSWNFKKVDGHTGIVTHSAGHSPGRYLSSRLSVIAPLSRLSSLLRHSLKSIKGSCRVQGWLAIQHFDEDAH